MKLITFITLFITLLSVSGQAPPQLNPSLSSSNLLPYNIGNPTLKDIYVVPGGNPSNDGSSPAKATSFGNAWHNLIPRTGSNAGLTTGYRILLGPGTYTPSDIPTYFENAWGTYDYPIILQSLNGANTITLQSDLNVFNCRYLYLLELKIVMAGDMLHFEQCQYVVLRGVIAQGLNKAAHEGLKVNQCQHFYIESCDISGAYENPIDFVAVQYGHILWNKIHDGDDWCIYLKGGSSYFRIAYNEIYNCGTGGFTAGQGTGFEYMTSNWLYYETMDIKFTNNYIHDTVGACFGCNGCFDTLYAYNTCRQTGSRSHLIEVVPGSRSCDGDTAACTSRYNLGGWGPRAPFSGPNDGGEFIPNKNVFIINNRLTNTPPFQSQWQQFTIRGPQATSGQCNVPSPARFDDNLVISGNVIHNGGPDMPLGVGEGCSDSNPTCNAAQLVRDNVINRDGDMEVWPLPEFPTWGSGVDSRVPSGVVSNQAVDRVWWTGSTSSTTTQTFTQPATTTKATSATTKVPSPVVTSKSTTLSPSRTLITTSICLTTIVIPCITGSTKKTTSTKLPTVTITVTKFKTKTVRF